MSARNLLLLGLLGALFWWQHRTPAGVFAGGGSFPAFEFSPQGATQAPLQRELRAATPLHLDDYVVTPLAEFQVTGRVLGTRRYRAGREADLSPIDFAMGWGPMTEPAVLDQLEISQSARYYAYRYRAPPIPPPEIVRHSANMHLIPATGEVAAQLLDVQPAQHVRFKGFLVKVEARDGWRWQSSMTRHDSGRGACELVVVDAIEVL